MQTFHDPADPLDWLREQPLLNLTQSQLLALLVEEVRGMRQALERALRPHFEAPPAPIVPAFFRVAMQRDAVPAAPAPIGGR